jgi:hypothetical protein
MDSFIVAFFSFPKLVIYAFIGGAAGAVAALVTVPIRSKAARRFVPIVSGHVAYMILVFRR